MLDDYRSAPIGDEHKALFRFVDRVNRASATIREADVEEVLAAGWSQEAVYDAVTVCALFNFYNRWVDAMGVQDMPAAAYEAAGVRIAAHGYAPDEGQAPNPTD